MRQVSALWRSPRVEWGRVTLHTGRDLLKADSQGVVLRKRLRHEEARSHLSEDQRQTGKIIHTTGNLGLDYALGKGKEAGSRRHLGSWQCSGFYLVMVSHWGIWTLKTKKKDWGFWIYALHARSYISSKYINHTWKNCKKLEDHKAYFKRVPWEATLMY